MADETAPPVENPGKPAVSYLADEHAGTTGILQHLAEQAALSEQALRLRVSVALWNAKSGQYASWKGQSWKVNLPGPSRIMQAQEFRLAMEEFFDLIAQRGVEETAALLSALRRPGK